ncbi:PilZ domain-containing protein [Sphingomonas flavescens]|uniref:PilZ domain-containing protein n=1 Tax=Sphingomonas flavescens TaxID=3132797 RepID=UPI002803C151|nr:PilZ domain-containing protein [Sphingomonas limnosediminicola]
MTNAVQSLPTELREEPRASLYLAASLYSEGQSVPVKIRNLSNTGALVELSTPLVEGGVVQLVRGSLIVHALIIWTEGLRCGLKFSGVVDVQRWRIALSNGDQQRVDDIVRTIKARSVPLRSAEETRPGEGEKERPLSADLRLAADLLETLGECLANDERIIASHGPALQHLDIAMQMIGAVEAILSGQSDLATDATKIISLRRSADQALAAMNNRAAAA